MRITLHVSRFTAIRKGNANAGVNGADLRIRPPTAQNSTEKGPHRALGRVLSGCRK